MVGNKHNPDPSARRHGGPATTHIRGALAMSAADIENRVEALETKYAQLEKLVQQRPSRSAWRDVVGMFSDDPQIESLQEESARIREQDRNPPHDRGAS